MTEQNQNDFLPSEIWTPRSADYKLDEPIEKARASMNAENTDQLIQDLRARKERQNGQGFAILNGSHPDEYSTTDAMALFDSASVGLSDNRLVKAEFVRRVAYFSGITDSQGKYKPVIVLASPAPGSTVRLTKDQRQEVKDGELGIAANEMLRVIEMKDIGEVALLGFSEGAGLALAGARQAYSANLNVTRVGLGDPTTSESRRLRQLTQDLMQAKDFTVSKEATSLDAQTATLNATDMARFVAGVFKPINWRTLIPSLGRDTFEKTIQEILDEGRVDKLVVGYGSVMAKPETIEPALQRLERNDHKDTITSIRLEGVDHTWGDELPLLAKLYMRAMV